MEIKRLRFNIDRNEVVRCDVQRGANFKSFCQLQRHSLCPCAKQCIWHTDASHYCHCFFPYCDLKKHRASHHFLNALFIHLFIILLSLYPVVSHGCAGASLQLIQGEGREYTLGRSPVHCRTMSSFAVVTSGHRVKKSSRQASSELSVPRLVDFQ